MIPRILIPAMILLLNMSCQRAVVQTDIPPRLTKTIREYVFLLPDQTGAARRNRTGARRLSTIQGARGSVEQVATG